MGHKKVSAEQVEGRVSEKGVAMVGPYAGTHHKTAFRCQHGHTWIATPNKVMRETGCPSCSKNNPENARTRFYEIIKERGFVVSGNYEGAGKKVLIACNMGHTVSMKPSSVLAGCGCRKCCGSDPDQARDNFLKLAKEKGFEITGGYIRAKDPVTAICPAGHATSIIPGNLGRGTKLCSNCDTPQTSKFKKEFQSIAHQKSFRIIGIYKRASIAIEMECPKGHTFKIQPRSFRNGVGCKVCSGHNFDRSAPGFFYVYHLNRSSVDVVGFGITNSLPQRQKDHRREFKKSGTAYELLLLKRFESGSEALKLEKTLKAHPEIINFGIEGFKTECLPISLKNYVLGMAASKSE